MKEIVKQNKLNKDVTQQKSSMEMTQFQIKLHNFTFLFGPVTKTNDQNDVFACKISIAKVSSVFKWTDSLAPLKNFKTSDTFDPIPDTFDFEPSSDMLIINYLLAKMTL